MAGTNKGRERHPLRRDKGLLKCDALIARQDRLAHANHAVAVADRRRYMGHLVTSRLPLPDGAAKLMKGFQEKRLDIVRLQAPCVGAFHILSYAPHAARVHNVMRKRTLFEQILSIALATACV